MDKEEIAKQLLEDIKKYLVEGSNVKPYAQSMSELDKWLSEIKK